VLNTTQIKDMPTVTATDANRRFSALLREVARGQSFTVVSRGRPVATLNPAQPEGSRRLAARASLIERLREQTATGERGWSRDELYQR
jgi:prevent-host-death family protein